MFSRIFNLKYLALSSVIIGTWLLIFLIDYTPDVSFVHFCWKQNLSFQYYSSKPNSKINRKPFSYRETPVDSVASVPTSFFIEVESFCKERPNLRVLAYVHSAISNTERRSTTRFTWANVSSEVGTLFFVGQAKNKEEAEIVESESRIYGDIVQGYYTDEYKLLVYKALNALYWITKNCASVPWVLHADDDILLDVNYLLNVLDDFEKDKRTNEIFCRMFMQSETQRDGKWKVDEAEYPCKYYHPYCDGPCWFTTSSVIQKLFDSVPKTKFLWVDDAYLTGLAAEVANIKRSDVPVVYYKMETDQVYCVLAWVNVGNRMGEWPEILHYNNNCTFTTTNNNKNNNNNINKIS